MRSPGDGTDAAWAHVEPLIPPAKRGGGKRRVDMRTAVNGVMDGLRRGCQWRYLASGVSVAQHREPLLLPVDLDGTPDHLQHALYRKCRATAEQQASPTACRIGSETREERRILRQAQEEGLDRSAWVRRGQSFGELRRSRARSGTFAAICNG